MNTIVAEFLPDELVEEAQETGSFNHSYLQVNLGALLKMLGQYTVCADVSLDISSLDLAQFQIKARTEIKPDLCLYPKRGLSRPVDILKMDEPPLLAIEILSPLQGSYEILQKFRVYFALGVQSCWLVEPATAVVAVYSSLENHAIFSEDDVVDDVIGIRLSLQEIFN